MPSKPFPDFITTDQRIIVSEWTALSKLIAKHSLLRDQQVKQNQSDTIDLNTILTDQQIFDAIQGAYHPLFKIYIPVATMIAFHRTHAQIDKEDNLKENLAYLAAGHTVVSMDAINHCRDQLNDAIVRHNQQWEGQLFLWQMQLTGALRDSGLQISEHELDEFSAPDSLSQVNTDFLSLNIDPPTYTLPLGFHQYFRLKCYLLVIHALSRQHQPHGAREISAYMKYVKKPLATIESESKKIALEQQSQVDEIMSQLPKVELK